ncbi:MAG: hypothetical protein BGN95_23055 [Sphingomonas sp. 66-10]|uniref:hypothetical protein n=1 Tax=Sphingomonas sp. 66-10 TaxID=1895848 RepID=UPI000869A759|nr:hypothetical protein [Sphingomonas sp. 66-10]ODU68807.1 MAG: hypothetical protein ABT11_15295 [Novosphingobium sp. SCN 66-18]OJU21471.1 MAG: hypothetical protein BGN95_23055 [Sphingomonas sp. 66-10]
MLVTVLAILYDGIQTVELHEAEPSAWAALVRFIDARWTDRFQDMPVPPSEAERVERFFADSPAEWLVAEADVSELHEALDLATLASLR